MCDDNVEAKYCIQQQSSFHYGVLAFHESGGKLRDISLSHSTRKHSVWYKVDST